MPLADSEAMVRHGFTSKSEMQLMANIRFASRLGTAACSLNGGLSRDAEHLHASAQDKRQSGLKPSAAACRTLR